MNMKNILAMFLISLAVTLVSTGCDNDDPAGPGPISWKGIEGSVVDGDGEPLQDIAIGILYDLPHQARGARQPIVITDPLAKPATQISFDLPETGTVHVWITDYAGDHVVSLIDGTVQGGEVHVMWQGLNEDGDPVPAGLYYAHIRIGDEEPTVAELFLLLIQPAEFLRAPNAVTGSQGTFSITDDLIPVGEILTGVDEFGEPTNEITIPATMTIFAVRAGDPDPVWTSVAIEYVVGENNGGIELVLP